MKANELRIGNWVNVISWDWSDFNGETDIDIKELEVIDSGFANVVGIPLTEEWLIRFEEVEKAPFDDDIKDYYLIKRCGFFDIIYEDDDNIYIDFGDALKKVKYLHQLQNLYFALTNEELTIKL